MNRAPEILNAINCYFNKEKSHNAKFNTYWIHCLAFIVLLLLISLSLKAQALPANFINLHTIAPSIKYDIRYAGIHNFMGRRVSGYYSAKCILTVPAAKSLAKVEAELMQSGLSLMVYDCYRPQHAVNDFIAWSKNKNNKKMKQEFYPNVNKKDLFKLGYIASKSGHSRGSTVDLTIIPRNHYHSEKYVNNSALRACYAAYLNRFHDGSIDMGTGYDCMDERSYPLSKQVSITAHYNRMILRNIMKKYGFVPYKKEWWHFTLKNEAYPTTYFNTLIK